MSPKQLEYFLEIYQCKSIKKAAEKLFISPQAISKTLKEIEEELKINLFVRGTKQLEPTKDAEYLKNHAMRILEEYEKINRIKNFSEHENKVVTIHSIDGFLQYLTVKFIEDFKKSYPEIILNIVESTEKDIIEKLKSGEINTAVITKPLESDTFSCSYLYKNRNCLVIHKDNVLAKKDKIDLSDLDNQPIAGKGSSYSCYSSNISKLFQRNINPKIMLETTNDLLIIDMANKNLAIGITLDYIAFTNKNENTVIKSINGDGQFRNTYWIQNTYAILTNEEQCFRDFMVKWIDEHKSYLFNFDK